MKILIVGGDNDHTLFHFIKDLKKTNPDYQIDYLSIHPEKNTEVAKKLYREMENVFFMKYYSKSNILKQFHSLFYFFLSFNFWLSKIPISFTVKSYKELKAHFIAEFRAYLNYHKILKNSIPRYEIINIQSLPKRYALLVPYLCKNTNRLLISFWGSDLLRYSSKSNSYFLSQKLALELADEISIQTFELKEIICAKFGRHLFEKIHVLFFGLPELRFNLIDAARAQEKKITKEKIIIRIGYTGQPEQQHLAIIEALHRMSPAIKEKIFLYLPMTYLREAAYTNMIEQKLAAKFPKQYQIFRHFLPTEEYMKIVVQTDIFINCRTTDAFNGAMIESIYAGNIVVNGAWLPYKKLSLEKIHHTMVEILSDLTNTATTLVNNIAEEKRKCEKNRKIREIVGNDKVISAWTNWYQS